MAESLMNTEISSQNFQIWISLEFIRIVQPFMRWVVGCKFFVFIEKCLDNSPSSREWSNAEARNERLVFMTFEFDFYWISLISKFLQSRFYCFCVFQMLDVAIEKADWAVIFDSCWKKGMEWKDPKLCFLRDKLAGADHKSAFTQTRKKKKCLMDQWEFLNNFVSRGLAYIMKIGQEK